MFGFAVGARSIRARARITSAAANIACRALGSPTTFFLGEHGRGWTSRDNYGVPLRAWAPSFPTLDQRTLWRRGAIACWSWTNRRPASIQCHNGVGFLLIEGGVGGSLG
jgi:hypothetical protein